jgi:hypothetical protein
MSEIPVAMCFDVEPDERAVALEPRPWRGFERLIKRVGSLRNELEALTGRPVRFNWFLRMDPQIERSHGHAGWVVEQYGESIHAWRAAGDAVGVHPHCWRWSRARSRWVIDNDDADWVDECVRVSFEAYAATFGEPCRVVRFGDRFVTTRVLRVAAQLGARFDLSVEPGMPGTPPIALSPLAIGRIPSQTKAPREPYVPSTSDPFRRAGPQETRTDPLWIIPLTAIEAAPLIPLWRRLRRRVIYPNSPRHRTAALFATWRTDGFWNIVDRELDRSSRPYLAFATRSDTFIRPPLNDAFEGKLKALGKWPTARRLSFVTPEAIVASTQSH